jgi:D-xylose transport system substrate-binding protein
LRCIVAACVEDRRDDGKYGDIERRLQRSASDKIRIGFSMATLKEERWQRDRDAFEAHCKRMNVECVVTVATTKPTNRRTTWTIC